MPKVPENIRNSFLKVKDRFDGTLVLRNINGHFYVYRASSRWDKKEKRVRSNQEYLGRINAKGLFIEKSASYEEIELEKAKALIESHGGRIIFDEISQREQISNNQADVDEIDKKILMILSMNARATMPFIAKMTGLSTSAAEYRVKKLEEKLGIRYILELDVRKLGFTTYLLMIKFDNKIPMAKEIITALKDKENIQFAALTTGDFDLVIYLLGYDPVETEDDLWKLRSETPLGNYKATWHLIPFGQVYSFIPIRGVFLDNFYKIRQRSKQESSELVSLRERELILLKELNENSTRKFTEIENKNKLVRGSARLLDICSL